MKKRRCKAIFGMWGNCVGYFLYEHYFHLEYPWIWREISKYRKTNAPSNISYFANVPICTFVWTAKIPSTVSPRGQTFAVRRIRRRKVAAARTPSPSAQQKTIFTQTKSPSARRAQRGAQGTEGKRAKGKLCTPKRRAQRESGSAVHSAAAPGAARKQNQNREDLEPTRQHVKNEHQL